MSLATKALADLSAQFGSRVDPRLSVLEDLPSQDRERAAVLASVLGQELTIAGLRRLLRELSQDLGPDWLSVGASDLPRLRAAARRRTWLLDWAHRESLPGWILASADFLRTHGDPSGWESGFAEPADLVRACAQELPWMGAQSSQRIKAWRLARWTVRGEIGPCWTSGRASLRIPTSSVERPLKALGLLPSGWSDWPQPRRTTWLQETTREVAPSDPASLWVPLETVLSRGKSGPACQEFLGGCRSCRVRSRCPSPAFDGH